MKRAVILKLTRLALNMDVFASYNTFAKIKNSISRSGSATAQPNIRKIPPGPPMMRGGLYVGFHGGPHNLQEIGEGVVLMARFLVGPLRPKKSALKSIRNPVS